MCPLGVNSRQHSFHQQLYTINEKRTKDKKSISLVSGSFAGDFFPFTQTRSVAEIRCGILSIREKWEYHFSVTEPGAGATAIPANTIPGQELIEAIGSGNDLSVEKALAASTRLMHAQDIVHQNDREIRRDFGLITHGRISKPIPESNRVILPVPEKVSVKEIFPAPVFLEEGAVLEHSVLNATAGPIYIGKNALVMEGCMIRGPFALGEGSVLKMGSRIYGATTVGPFSTAGGEIKNSVIFGHSNKGHDGYLGDSVIGEWCNLGAGTSVSNVKNSGGKIKYWNPLKKEWLDGGMKCGLFMGDYSRSAINTSFNTGTVVGVCVHVFGKGLTPSYLSSFTWGYDPGETYGFEKAIQHIQQWMHLKNSRLTSTEIKQLKNIFDQQNNLS
ncbi:MAG: putative sugar nucleotidyl transferase [Chitinophagales bacterium]